MTLDLTNSLRLLVLTALTGCPVVFHPGLYAQSVPVSETKPTSTTYFPQLPPAKEKITAAVHEFRDLANSFRQTRPTTTAPITAGAQNHTSILLNALRESGWFVPIEYGNIVNLLSEPRSTQPTGSQLKADGKAPVVPSADIFLESGILSADANTITDENGSQYFGKGSPRQYQQDRVTVYLRAVSTQSGKVLKTVYTSKTIFSLPVNANLFRYISFKRPYEAETGLIPITPGQFALTEAIKKAVQGLIIEGVRDGLWLTDDKSATAMTALISAYEQEKMDTGEIDRIGGEPAGGLFGIRPRMNAPFVSIQPYAGIMRYSGDYANRDTKAAYGASIEMYITPAFGIQVNAATGTMASRDAFSVNVTSVEGNLVLRPTPFQRWTPILYGGVGMISRSRSTPFDLYGANYLQAQGGIGLQFSPTRVIGFRTTFSYNQPFTDSLDGQITGDHKDYYTRATLGLVIHIGRFMPKTRSILFTQAAPPKQ